MVVVATISNGIVVVTTGADVVTGSMASDPQAVMPRPVTAAKPTR